MSPELSQRIAAAFDRGRATVSERNTLIQSVASPAVVVFDDLPYDARTLLLKLEDRGVKVANIIDKSTDAIAAQREIDRLTIAIKKLGG